MVSEPKAARSRANDWPLVPTSILAVSVPFFVYSFWNWPKLFGETQTSLQSYPWDEVFALIAGLSLFFGLMVFDPKAKEFPTKRFTLFCLFVSAVIAATVSIAWVGVSGNATLTTISHQVLRGYSWILILSPMVVNLSRLYVGRKASKVAALVKDQATTP
jgi:hypothetical protein